MSVLANFVIWIVALFYGYGALVHILNMLGLSGFEWSSAPFKWQALDVIYLALDLVVLVGFFLGARLSFVAFYVAALSQIALYTVFRDWILDVPVEFAVSDEQRSYLWVLVAFHSVTIVLVSLALRSLRLRGADGGTSPA